MGKQQYHFVSMAEAKKLKKGDIIFIGLRNGTSLTYQKAVVLSPLFWNSDSDEPDYELETTNGFVDINSIYLPKDDDDNEEIIEVISRQAVIDTLIQTYFKYESERLDAIQDLPIYTIPMFWNSDSDEPDYELETTNGFVDINSIYLPKDDDDNEEIIEVISRQAVIDTLIQTYFKYESERLDAIQDLPIYTIPKSREEE